MSVPSKTTAVLRPTLYSLAVQSSSYGQTIPVVFGRMRSTVYPIWMNNLRKSSDSSLIKQIFTAGIFGGSSNNYVVCIDYLLGVNPIAGVLQIWYENGYLPFNLGGYSVTLTSAKQLYTITDTNFYFLMGVLMSEDYNVTFDDFGGQGPQTLTGTFQVPLWNRLYAGPDPACNSAYRYTGYSFSWLPCMGKVVAFDEFTASRVINFGYLQFSHDGSPLYGQAGSYIPLTVLRLTFEPMLGNGPEYSASGDFTAQQIKYPHYAGMGSPNLDLGSSSQALPTIGPELAGQCMLYQSGDADFADMVEYIFKSGIIQAAYDENAETAQSPLQTGLSCFNFPAVVQRKAQPTAGDVTYDLANSAGNVLVAIMHSSAAGTAWDLTDSAGNTWTALLPNPNSLGFQVWYATNSIFAPVTAQNTVHFPAGSGTVVILEIAGVDSFDAFVQPLAGIPTATLTTTNDSGKPALMLAISDYTTGNAPGDPDMIRWPSLIANPPCIWATDFIMQWRTTNYPGSFTITEPSGNFNQMFMLSFKATQPSAYPVALGDILDGPSLDQCRLQCRANGLWGSLKMDSQRKASDWLQDIYMAMNAAPVWSGFTLKSIPYSEVSYLGNGAIFTAPTASGPVVTIGEDDYATDKNPPVTITRKAQVDVPDLLQVQFPDRENSYNDTIISQPETAAIAMYGPRKASPTQLRCICEASVARMILGVMIRRQNYLRNTYSFTLKQHFAWLEPMDLIAINDSLLGLVELPVRLTSIQENDNLELECEAEPFIYGCSAPQPAPVTPNQATPQPTGTVPASVNAPVFIETVPGLDPGQIWIVVSDSDPTYGGCQVWMSTDDGVSYQYQGTVQGNAITGELTADWPSAADPDTTNNLSVNLTESRGALDTAWAVSDEDSFLSLCFVAGGAGSIPYELMSYAVATMPSAYHFTLTATGGNKLRRAVFSAPTPGQGVDHPSTSRFAFIGSGAAGVWKYTIPSTLIGKSLKFIFPAYNQFNSGLQNQSDCTVYSFTPTGQVGTVGLSYTNTPGAALSQPSGVFQIDMAQVGVLFSNGANVNYNARTFTVADPGVGNTQVYYVTIADPTYLGDIGALTNLTAYAETTEAKVGVPGYTFMGSIYVTHTGGSGVIVTIGGWPAGESFLINGT